MPFLSDIEQLRAIDWGQKHLWDVRFDDGPPPFNTFFPAVELHENKANLESYEFTRFMSTYKIPKSTLLKSIKLTFLDDKDNTLSEWLDDWINRVILGIDVNNNQWHTATLEESVKSIQIQKLDREGNVVSPPDLSYWVYPEGALVFEGTSDSGLRQYGFTFIIAGTTGTKVVFP